MRQIVILVTVLGIVQNFSCSKGPDFARSYGHETSVNRALGNFHSIKIGQKFTLYLTQDTSRPQQITIAYGSNLIEKISAEIEDGVLNIKDNNQFNWVRNLEVRPVCTLNVHQLKYLETQAASAITCLDTISSPDLRIQAHGVGNHQLILNCGIVSGGSDNSGYVTMKGWGGVLAWSCENGAGLDASEMKSADVYMYHYTERDVFVDPSIIFKAYVYNNGNIYYYREPSFLSEKKEYGVGKIIKK